ncbi:MAG: tetratricopeptide repeat protein, partial [Bacteroidales bacterium]|nr:tetratricopeptide repeat protein [Bacteroidales bacterium]
MNKTLVKYIFLVFLLVLSTQAIWAQTQTELNYKLLQAAKNNYTDSVKYWLEKGADINFADENGYGALHYAVANFNYSLTSDLLGNNASTKQLKNGYRAPIYTAASLGNLRACYQLKKHGAKFDIKDSENHTPHDYALNFGYLRVVKYLKNPDSYSDEPTFYELLKQTIESYGSHKYHEAYLMLDSTFQCAKNEIAKDHEYFKSIDNWRLLIVNNAFYNSATSNLTDSVKFWLEKGANVDYLDENGNTALLQAIGYYNNELVEYLINKGASLNTRNDITSPPILIAAIKGNLRACYLLWKNGADLSVTDTDNKTTAYDYAIQNGYLRIAEFLKNTDSYNEESTFRELLIKSKEYRKSNEFEEAINFAKEAYDISQKELSENCIDRDNILQNIIVCYNDVKDLDSQLKYYHELVQIRKSVHGEKSIEHIQTLNGLGRVYCEIGAYNEANLILDSLFKIAEIILNKNATQWTSIYNNRATYLRTIGDFSNAEEYFIKALEISQNNKNEYDIALLYNNLAELYSELGRYHKAEELYIDALNIRRKILGENNVLYAMTLNNIATVLENQYKYEGVKELYEESLKIIDNLIGEENDSYATTLSNYANFLRTINDNGADSLFLKTLNIQEHVLGKVHPNYATTLGNYAVYLSLNEKHNEAIKLNLKTAEILSNNFGDNHSSLIPVYDNLCLDYYKIGDLTNSVSYNQKSYKIFISELNFVFAFSSNESRKNYVTKFQNTLNGYKAITFNAFKTNKAYSNIEYNIELFSNSLLLNTSRNIQQSILNSKDSSLISTYEDFKNLRRQINYLQQQPVDKQQGLPELEEKANQLDKQLTKASQAYQQNKENLNIQWQDVQNNLKENEAAVQFISFPYYNKR